MLPFLGHSAFLNHSSHFAHHFLPFLAPRVFAPWPKYLSKRRLHSTSESTCPIPEDIGQSDNASGESLNPSPPWRYLTLSDKRPIKTAFVHLTRTSRFRGGQLIPFSRRWTIPFARLSDGRWDTSHRRQNVPVARFDRHLEKLLEELAQHKQRVITGEGIELRTIDDNTSSTVARILLIWRRKPSRKKLLHWPMLMLQALKLNPEAALKVLFRTVYRPAQPSYAVADCLEYITSYHILHHQPPDRSKIDRLFDVIMLMLRKSRRAGVARPLVERNVLFLSPRTIWLLAKHLNGNQLVEFYHSLAATDNLRSANNLLQIVYMLARSRKTDLAVEGLKRLSYMNEDFTDPKIESVCATIFLSENRQPDTKLSDFDIFSLFLDLGLQPNLIFYNIWLLNMIRQGKPEIAWDIYNNMSLIGIMADEYTYSILLNDAKLRSDYTSIRLLSDTISARKVMHPYIVNDLLHSIFLGATRAERTPDGTRLPPEDLLRMISLYKRFFSTKTLSTLFPPNISHINYISSSKEHDLEKMDPPPETLVIMITAFLAQFNRADMVIQFYKHFQNLVSQSHPVAVAVVETGRAYDAIIKALGRHKQALHVCTEVISDMLHYKSAKVSPSAPSNALSTISTPGRETASEHTEKPQSGVQPTVRTWSTLLYAFISHGQMQAAEKILEMMRSRGVKPNRVTWNSLAIGYAHMQSVDGTISAIERLEVEGWEVDDWTMKALRAIKDRDKLISKLEEKDRERAAESAFLAEKVQEAIDVEEQQAATLHA